MDNLEIYNKVRTVPQNAQRKISGGRLDGKTDINPMWRIKSLTENFGMCGVGWKYEIVNKWLEPSEQTGEIAAFVDILLYINNGGEWSAPIPGTGGSTFVAKEKNGPHMSDECYKMALTDAISVACKALGVGADVYWEADKTKYTTRPETPVNNDMTDKPQQQATVTVKSVRMQQIEHLIKDTSFTIAKVDDWILRRYGKAVPIDQLSDNNYKDVYNALDAAIKKEKEGSNGSN